MRSACFRISSQPQALPSTINSASGSTTSLITMSSKSIVTVLDDLTSTSSLQARNWRRSIVPLQRLECVRVTKKIRRNGRRVYVVAVFFKRNAARRRLSEDVYKVLPASKLSPQAMRDFMMTEREPDFVVERRFSDFRQLRDNIVAVVSCDQGHRKACTGCQDLIRLLVSPQHRNWTWKRMFGNTEQRYALLTTFINDLLLLMVSAIERTISRKVAEDEYEEEGVETSCRIQEQVAEMLQKFLKRKYQPSLGII